MSEREWKPGDVAAIPFSRGWVRCIYTPKGWVPSDNNSDPAVKGYEDVHPLVVIDPSNVGDLDRLRTDLINSGWIPDNDADSLDDILREFASPNPPKPDEPMGLGSVVEDKNGERWVRAGLTRGHKADDWRLIEGDRVGWWSEWSDIAVVRVLSEGVSDA